MVSRAFFVVSLLCSLSTSWSTSDEDIHQDKNIKPVYPKKYLPLVLSKFRIKTEDSISSTTEEASAVLNVNKNEEEEVKDMEAIDNEDDNPRTDSERSRRSAITTFCVEIRPSSPYQKPFQVCEPIQVPTEPPRRQPYYPPPYVPVATPYHVPQPHIPGVGSVYGPMTGGYSGNVFVGFGTAGGSPRFTGQSGGYVYPEQESHGTFIRSSYGRGAGGSYGLGYDGRHGGSSQSGYGGGAPGGYAGGYGRSAYGGVRGINNIE